MSSGSLPSPLKRCSIDSGVWPWRSSTVVVGAPDGLPHPEPNGRLDPASDARAGTGAGSGRAVSDADQVRPSAAASIAAFASASAAEFCARGIQVNVTFGNPATSCAASARKGPHAVVLDLPAPAHLLHDELGIHPHVDLRRRGDLLRGFETGDQSAVLGDVVGGGADRCRAFGEHQITLTHERAVAGRARIAAGAAVGFDHEPHRAGSRTHRPLSSVRMRMRRHSS